MSRFSPNAAKRLPDDGLDAPKPSGEGTRPLRVLIVENHPAMRTLIRTVVGSLAEVIGECGSGTEAVAAYTTQRPDVVLMDIAMPEVDGLTATRQIRAVDPDASVVIVTDYDGPELRERAQEAIGLFSDGTTEDHTERVTWSSSDGTVARISNAGRSEGLATGVGSGMTDISARRGSVLGTVALSVTVP